MAIDADIPSAVPIWREYIEEVRAIDMKKSSEVRFIEGAEQHGGGTIEGDSPVANKAYKKIITALRELRSLPDKGVSFLASQLASDNPSVVTWSALHLLPHKPDEAIAALQRVSETASPLIAFGAEITLKEWRAGRLNIE